MASSLVSVVPDPASVSSDTGLESSAVCAPLPTDSHDYTSRLRYGNNKLDLLRKRQVAANKSTTASSQGLVHDMNVDESVVAENAEWHPEEGGRTLIEGNSSPRSRPSRKVSMRARRRPSDVNCGVLFTTPVRQSPKRNSGSSTKRSCDKSDQRWITLLERNNEELMSQIALLTANLSETEQTLKSRLKTAEQEILTLREQLSEQDRSRGRLAAQYQLDLSALRAHNMVDVVAGDVCQSRGVKHSIDSNPKLKALTKERETFLLKIKRKDDELLRIKKRNAELAEQILHKRSLEITVEGQNRYLLELSAALNETKRGNCSEPSSSPQFQSSPALPPSPVFTPHFSGHTDFRTRPISFDGTRWAQNSLHQRHHSLMELGDPLPRPEASSRSYNTASIAVNAEPLSPPLTEQNGSPSGQQHEPSHGDGDGSQCRDDHKYRQVPILQKNAPSRLLRPSLQRNESSLWFELQQDQFAEDESSKPPVESLEKSLEKSLIATSDAADGIVSDERAKAAEFGSVMLSSVRDSRSTLLEYAFRIKGDTITSSVQLALLGYNWIRFLVLLLVAITLLVLEGPASLLQIGQGDSKSTSERT